MKHAIQIPPGLLAGNFSSEENKAKEIQPRKKGLGWIEDDKTQRLI